jgi:hypothetical protein
MSGERFKVMATAIERFQKRGPLVPDSSSHRGQKQQSEPTGLSLGVVVLMNSTGQRRFVDHQSYQH